MSVSYLKTMVLLSVLLCSLALSGCITTGDAEEYPVVSHFKSGKIINVVIHNAWFDFGNSVDIYFNDGCFVNINSENERFTIYSLYSVSNFNRGHNCSIWYSEYCRWTNCTGFKVLDGDC